MSHDGKKVFKCSSCVCVAIHRSLTIHTYTHKWPHSLSNTIKTNKQTNTIHFDPYFQMLSMDRLNQSKPKAFADHHMSIQFSSINKDEACLHEFCLLESNIDIAIKTMTPIFAVNENIGFEFSTSVWFSSFRFGWILLTINHFFGTNKGDFKMNKHMHCEQRHTPQCTVQIECQSFAMQRE